MRIFVTNVHAESRILKFAVGYEKKMLCKQRLCVIAIISNEPDTKLPAGTC